jgi:hypothetical protein
MTYRGMAMQHAYISLDINHLRIPSTIVSHVLVVSLDSRASRAAGLCWNVHFAACPDTGRKKLQ